MSNEQIAILERVREALYNVPLVGEQYDQQHSDTHQRAALELKELIRDLVMSVK